MDFITVYTTLDPSNAELIRSRLDSAGIVVNIKNEDRVLGIETSGYVQVQVPEDRAEDARELVAYKEPPSP